MPKATPISYHMIYARGKPARFIYKYFTLQRTARPKRCRIKKGGPLGRPHKGEKRGAKAPSRSFSDFEDLNAVDAAGGCNLDNLAARVAQ